MSSLQGSRFSLDSLDDSGGGTHLSLLSRFSARKKNHSPGVVRHQRSRSEDLSALSNPHPCHEHETCACGRRHGKCKATYDLRSEFIRAENENSPTKAQARHPYGSPAMSHLIADIQKFSMLAGVKGFLSREETPAPVVDPEAEKTKEALKRVKKLEVTEKAKRSASVDLEGLVSWHKKKAARQTLDPITNSQEMKVRVDEDPSGIHVPLRNNPDGEDNKGEHACNHREDDAGAVYYQGVVNLPPPTPIQTPRKKEKRPSRDFVDSFPIWFLDGGEKSRGSDSSTNRNGAPSLGNVGGGATSSVSRNPVPKHLAPCTLSQTNGPYHRLSNTVKPAGFPQFDEALHGVRSIKPYLSAQDVLRPSTAPRRSGRKDQYDTQKDNFKVLDVVSAQDTSGSATAPDLRNQESSDRYISNAKVPGRRTSTNIPADTPAAEDSRPIIPPRKPSSNSPASSDSKFAESTRTVRPLGVHNRISSLESKSSTSTALPTLPRNIETEDHDPHVEPILSDKALPAPPQSDPRDRLLESTQEEWSHATSLYGFGSGGSTTTLDAIEAGLPEAQSLPRTPPPKGSSIINYTPRRSQDTAQLREYLRNNPRSPLSPPSAPPADPLPAVPFGQSPIRNARPVAPTTLMAGSLKHESYDPYRAGGEQDTILHKVGSVHKPSPLSITRDTHISTAEISSSEDDGPTSIDTVSSAIKDLTASMAVRQRQERDRRDAADRLSARRLSERNSIIGDRDTKFIGRSRKDLKMRHLTTARARAENDRLERRDSEYLESMSEEVGHAGSPKTRDFKNSQTLISPSSDKSYVTESRSTAIRIEAALAHPSRNDSPNRPPSSSNADSPVSRPNSIRRRTSFLGHSGTQELLLCKNTATATPPRTSVGPSPIVSKDENVSVNEPSSKADSRYEPSQNMRISIPPRNRLRHSQSMGPLTTIYSPAVGKETTSDNNTYSYHHSTSSNSSLQSNSNIGNASRHDDKATISAETVSSGSREALLEAKCSALESQLQRQRALTFALMYPQRVLEIAEQSGELLDVDLTRPPTLRSVLSGSDFTPPPSAQWMGMSSERTVATSRTTSVGSQYTTAQSNRSSQQSTCGADGESFGSGSTRGLRKVQSSWAVVNRKDEGGKAQRKGPSVEEMLSGFPRASFWSGYDARVAARMES